MKKVVKKIITAGLFTLISTIACAATLDKIAAVVNDNAITQSQLNQQLNLYRQQLQFSHAPMPAPAALRKQALQHIIDTQLQVQLAQKEGITVDDCALVSHHLGRVFTVENVSYDRLEVSSPGLDRPLRKASDFERFSGQQAKIKLRVALAGQRNFVGILQRSEVGKIGLEVDGSMLSFDLANIDKARLVPVL